MPEDEQQQLLDVKQRDRADHAYWTIESAIDLEPLDVDLYRSKSLYAHHRARGVFGGQVISQALVAATKCVDPAFALHSLHCYFLRSASPAVPIIYSVERLREGRSYTTRAVRATQKGQAVAIILCSFQRPEPWQPAQQRPMPANVPPPEQCELDQDFMRRHAAKQTNETLRNVMLKDAEDRERSPICIRTVPGYRQSDGKKTYMYWMCALNIPKYEPPLEKVGILDLLGWTSLIATPPQCVLSCMSDLRLIAVGARALGLRFLSKGPNELGIASSLDHAIYFYDDKFHCGDWLLYVVESPRGGSGRGIMHGRLYTRDGTLVAITVQEGVIRANVGPPLETETKLRPRL